ncbi:MAG TPA: PIN domain-containing protein [Bryobacteraceae bacterium]|nr:PIN domain-containing protein [Bryobacteraceae bacterium]
MLDTSVLIDSLTGPKHSGPSLQRALETPGQVALSVLVIYEWLRGPRTEREIQMQEFLVPASAAIPFSVEDAALSADIYRSVRRARSREIDIAIAACAIRHKAELWTLNPSDFADVPGLKLWRAR